MNQLEEAFHNHDLQIVIDRALMTANRDLMVLVENTYNLKERLMETIKVYGTSYGDFIECMFAGTQEVQRESRGLEGRGMFEELNKFADFNKTNNLFELAMR